MPEPFDRDATKEVTVCEHGWVESHAWPGEGDAMHAGVWPMCPGANPEGWATRVARENLRRLDEQYKVLVNEILELVHGAPQTPTLLIAELSEVHRVPRIQVAEVLSDLIVANIVELSPLGVVKLASPE